MIDGWMDEWMDGWMEGWIDGSMVDGWMDRWMMDDGWKDGWKDGQTDKRKEGWKRCESSGAFLLPPPLLFNANDGSLGLCHEDWWESNRAAVFHIDDMDMDKGRSRPTCI